jgi:hypothetical protein
VAGVIDAGKACAQGTTDAKFIVRYSAARSARSPIKDEVKWNWRALVSGEGCTWPYLS